MITETDLLNFNVYKKEPHTGSDRGMRYMLRKEEKEKPILSENGGQAVDEEGNPKVEKLTVLAVYAWPEPFSFEKTSEELKQREEFAFSVAGQKEALLWLNQLRASKNDYWEEHIGFRV